MIKRYWPKCLSALLLCACISLHAAPPPGSFSLTFEDEFDDAILDGTVWRQGSHDGSPAGSATEYGIGAAIKRENIELVNGVLRLTAHQEAAVQNGKNYNYSAGEISTFRMYSRDGETPGFTQAYGYFEARIRWDNITGLWPAFWTMPDRGIYSYQNYFNRSYLKFDLSSASLGTITSAVLRLKVAGIQNTSPTTAKTNTVAFGVDDDNWTETGITWNNMPVPEDPRWLDQSYDNRTIGSTVDLDVTAFIADQVANSDQVFTLCLADTLRNWNRIEYHSREATNASDRPVLIINGIPYDPVADAPVKGGTVANTNYGSEVLLSIWEAYGSGNNDTTVNTYGAGMEIDIMESLGVWGNTNTSHVCHWDGYSSNHKAEAWGRPPVDDTSQWHTYAIYWEPDLIEFYIDDVKTATFANTRVADTPMYLILSLQTGGWDGNTPSATIDGATMEVDWVRVWSGTKSTSPPTTTSIESNGVIKFGEDYTVYGGTANEGAAVALADNGYEFGIGRNGWVKFPLNYTITEDTVLKFTVDSAIAGEILGIGLENDNDETNDKRIFQLAGSQIWSNAWQDANVYITEGGQMELPIAIGSYYTGAISYLAIAADNDVNNQNYARFINVSIYEGEGDPDPIDIGDVNSGIAGTDWRTGTGYLMYSEEDTATRFTAFSGNADHLIAVYYSGGQWYADKNYGQTTFTPVASDVLLATIDFDNDTIESLEGRNELVYGIPSGYYTGNLVYIADRWDGSNDSDDGDFFVEGTTFTPNGPGAGSTYDVGNLNSGVAATDWRTGTGYLMYSEEDTATRFTAFSGNADHIIAVYYSGGQWYADKNYGQVAFTPVSTDVLLAAVDFTNNTVSSLQGYAGVEFGVMYGYYNGDLTYIANQWNGSNDSDEADYVVEGTFFTANSTGGASGPVDLGDVGDGVCATDWRTGSGYLMYSATDVNTRFNVLTGNADHVVAVVYNVSLDKWYADNNGGQNEFTPEAGDVLIATVDFDNDTVTSLEGQGGYVGNMPRGYETGDLTFQADYWDGSGDNAEGEFGVFGTTFTPW